MALFVIYITILFVLPIKCENCANITSKVIWATRFRQGHWYDQLHIYSSASSLQNVSLFATKFETNCGYYDLKAKSMSELELYKGYYTERFDEHFYPFMATIEVAYQNSSCSIYVERKLCKIFDNVEIVSHQVNILLTDYHSFMILHQCINERNFIMLLTQNEDYIAENGNKIGMEHAIADIITSHNINIHNRMFVWSTKNFCRHHIEEIYPQFYHKKYIDRRQVECSTNISKQTIELEDYWWHRLEIADERVESRRKFLNAVAFLVVAIASIIFVVYVFDRNFQLY